MATAEQFVNELGVTAVNAAQLEETLLQKVRCRLTSLDVMYSAQSQRAVSCFSNATIACSGSQRSSTTV